MAEADKNEGKGFTFKVNGIQIEAPQQEVVVHDILELAKKAGAMPGEPEDYILQGDKGQYGWNDLIDLEQDNVFITIRNAPTQVAQVQIDVDSADRVQGELEFLGYKTAVFDTQQGKVVSFPYTIETGSHKGTQVEVGVSFQEEGYPEYPPHWIHVTPPIDDGKGGTIRRYVDAQGRDWIAISRPPGDVWDRLLTKHMHAYINEHLRRLWKDT